MNELTLLIQSDGYSVEVMASTSVKNIQQLKIN